MNAYQNLMAPLNTEPGVADYYLWAPLSYFTTVAVFDPAGASSSGSDAHITANHVFAAGKGFHKILCAPNQNQLNFGSVGEPATLKTDNKLEVFLPGSYAALHEFVKNSKNVPGIILVRDSDESGSIPVYYQLGTDAVYCWLDAYEGGTGTTKSGKKGYKLTYSCASGTLYQYKGTITQRP